MRVRALHIVAALAVLAVVTAFILHRTRPQDANIEVSPPSTTGETPLPDDFAAQFAAERRQALMRDARERALDSARTDERERWENLKREQAAAARNSGALTQLQLAEQRAQRYELENIDRDWAPRAEAEILEKVSQTGIRVLDLRVECRTSICRLELLQSADERSISIPVGLALLQIDALQPSPLRQVDSAAGTRATVSYLARR
jgi:hypothetical protein